jgi:hypothetical protein
MNIHVSQQIMDKYPNMEFRGKPIQIKNRTVIKAENHVTDMSFWYSFEEDFFWFTNCEMPDWMIKK